MMDGEAYIGGEQRVSWVVEVGKRRAGVHNGGELHRHSLAVHGDRSDTDVVIRMPAKNTKNVVDDDIDQ